jgi:hypothetical protein
MQNMNGITEGIAMRELSLDETEMVGGGFSWGGLVHGVEHAAAKVGSKLGDAVVNGIGGAVGGAIGGAVVAAKWLKKEAAELPKEEPPGGPEEPFGPPVDFPWFG